MSTGTTAAAGRAPLRVGLVIGQLSIGGAEGQLRELVRGLKGRVETVVYCLHESAGTLVGDLQALDVPVRVIGGRSVDRARRLGLAVHGDGIDVLHSWLFIANGYAFASRFFGVRKRGHLPLITSARNCKMQGAASRFVNAVAFRGSAAIVVNSQDVAEYIVRHYRAPRARIRVIRNGIDTVRFHPPAAVRNGSGPIVTVGRLVVQKDHALFLRAAARLVAVRPTAQFVIVGEGPLRHDLEEQVRALGLGGHVRLLGERRDVEEVLRSASLFWLTSRWEGMPNVVLEAMATGVPPVVTDVGGTRELVRPGVEGFIVAPGDVDGLVEHSRTLLESREVWQRCSAAARARAAEFSVPRMAGQLAALYGDVARRDG